MEAGYKIRSAIPEDIESLVAFTIREAQESRGIAADTATVQRGVTAAFEEPPRAICWVVESPGGQVVASTSEEVFRSLDRNPTELQPYLMYASKTDTPALTNQVQTT